MKRSNSEFLGQKRRLSVNRETTSLPDELDGFYGRDGDMEAIRSLLLSDDASAGNLGVIPIVGMGGVGKTTLAQHVFNDKAVEQQFEIQAWVCVSDQFDVTMITEAILKKVTGTACPDDDLDLLQRKLKKGLDGKKFLLVLDDVWSENYEELRQLLTPLRKGGKGSKIIVTTRSQEAASKVQTVPTHYLRVLQYEDCWKLFAGHASLAVNSTADPELQEIGKEIVRKCGGLPLAARALGGVLRRQTKAEKWREVLKSEIWEVQNAKILPALALSYIHLPSHLKRCFAYCAIFPQDYNFKREKLVALWMSAGFLVQRKSHQSLEEMSDMCFDDLVSRSFFQPKYGDCFVMHDLMHDLARFVSGESCSRLEGQTSWKIGERTRHLSYERINQDAQFQGIHVTQFLRSFVLLEDSYYYCSMRSADECFNEEVIGGSLPTQKLLRILFLSCYHLNKLPNSISNLKHMRHLDLTETGIKLLPEAITALFNLEILILRRCRLLVELPAGMARLINLCQLDVKYTSLQRMPPEMGKLKKLSKLTYFVVGENGGSSIKELGNLHYLRGEILIDRLENVKDDGDAILKDKENLKKLWLRWKGNAGDSRQAKQVLERLQPHKHIECIDIDGYRGTEFPNWVEDICFSKLKQLGLHGCKNSLPSLERLPSLETLMISRMDAVEEWIISDDFDEDDEHEHDEGDDDDGGGGALEAIGVEFYRMCKPGEKPFSSLKRLEFSGMLYWREWSSCNGAFPVLEELELNHCPKLISVPSQLPNLKRLRIEGCGELDIENLLISTWATLETIVILYCGKLKCISVVTFPSLKELTILDCLNLESVGPTATTSDPLSSPSLTSLTIGGCSKLVSFLRGGLDAPNLKSMSLSHCGNLKSLPQGMHSLVPSLEKLSIFDCPKIDSFPEGGLPAALFGLEIVDSPLLIERCEWEIGEYWPMIKHIPKLNIW